MLQIKRYTGIWFFICCFCFLKGNAQETKIGGYVTNKKGEPLAEALVYLKNTNLNAITDEKGRYSLPVRPGHYEIVCNLLGYISSSRAITVGEKQSVTENFTLALDPTTELEEIHVTGKSVLQEVRESAYNVVAIDTKGLSNTTSDIARALEQASGVKIKRTGGVGSQAAISLNGFSGNHVKVFMDGIPMEGFGSAFQINNIPVNIAERVEVYKGVVPVELGADALGGAINIITNKSANTFLDASYAYGSFNTHRTNVNFGITSPSGLTVRVNAFQNYSDNDYKIKTQLLNLETNEYSQEEYWFKRFHDHYRNETVIVKAGVVNKSWADKFLIGATLGQEKADIQNANLMKIVYGGKEREATTVMGSVEYLKKDFGVKNLTLSASGNYSKVHGQNTDTLARQYNWQGEYRIKSSKGEGEYSLADYNNKSGIGTLNLRFTPSDKHQFVLNDVFSSYSRKATDDKANIENSTPADFIKRTNIKNVLGLSYKFEPDKRWNTSVFGKWYGVYVTGPIDTSSTSTAKYAEQHRDFQAKGYGITTGYDLTSGIRLKGSFEKTYRLPSERELFGDEILETGDASLKPENSLNVNFNITYSRIYDQDHHLYMDAGFIYRDIRDYIRRQIEQRYGGAYYTNHGKVKSSGVDAEIRYAYKKTFFLGGNVTYQDLRNKEKYAVTGQRLIYYNDRIPNVPYFFGNLDANYHLFNVLGAQNTLTLGYRLNYTHEFFRQWESEGSASSKKTIPEQVSHDLNLTYALKNGKYNISLEVRNLTDAMLYDNYSLQKPGRSITCQLRYFFFKQNN